MVEAPLFDGRTVPVIEQITQLRRQTQPLRN